MEQEIKLTEILFSHKSPVVICESLLGLQDWLTCEPLVADLPFFCCFSPLSPSPPVKGKIVMGYIQFRNFLGSAKIAMELEEKLEKAKETCPKDKTTVSCL